jgi:hypothetical protein
MGRQILPQQVATGRDAGPIDGRSMPSRRASRRLLVAAGLALALFGVQSPAHADGVPVPAGVAGTLTHFEAFVLTGCTPCVRETYPIATVPVVAMKLPTFPRVAGLPEGMTRAGEVEFELLRAYPLGNATRQQLAMRITLAIRTGLQGQSYLLGTGLMDEADVPGLAVMVTELAHAPDPAKSGAELSDAEVHGDNLRIGIVHTREEALAYIQAWSSTDLPRLALKQVWEVPSLYLPLNELSALQRGIEQVHAKIRQLRAE